MPARWIVSCALVQSPYDPSIRARMLRPPPALEYQGLSVSCSS